jgi:hypothetical protein
MPTYCDSATLTAPTTESPSSEPVARGTDFDLHGLVGIRLVDASAGDAAAVARQLGPISKPLEREPDIVVRFVDRLPGRTTMRLLGLNDAAFTDDAFFVACPKSKSPAWVQIPMDQLGGRCEIVCETGVAAVPLLIAIINLTVLARGLVPLHASAFRYEGRGVLVTGWSKGGKTETLLGFVANGAEYIGDEWIHLKTDADGTRMYGLPEPMRIWDWHLDDLPQFRATLGRRQRAKLRALRFVTRSLQWAGSNAVGRRVLPSSVTTRLTPLLERQRWVQVPPHQLFGSSVGELSGPLDQVMLVMSHAAPEFVVRPIGSAEVTERMAFSLQQERLPLTAKYQMFRFAFPRRRNPLIDDAERLERELLQRALAGKESYSVCHPYPVSPRAIFEATRRLVSS